MEAFTELAPDIVLIIGDRREALAAAIAAVHSGAKLVHLQGGETSGTLDQKYRWAITALADYHVPATQEARWMLTTRIHPTRMLAVGCPSSDLAREVLADNPKRTDEVLVCYHPNTCHPETAAEEAEALFSALPKDRPITVLSTNPDAGRGPIVEACKRHGYAMQNLEPREFARRLATCALAVGNSSGFVRDSGFYGCPVVLVGDRQNGRERGDNVMQVACVQGEIEAGIKWQLEHGPYPPSGMYGDGRVCERIVEALRNL
jgi:UDP-hydrolysing UDP-N-acetyl-D-glucosamine 2-epimerase